MDVRTECSWSAVSFQRPFTRLSSRACTNKMASASATPSSRDFQLIEGNSDGEHRPVPLPIARDRPLESTSGNYKRRGISDTTKVPLYERVKQFPGENLIVREGKLFCSGCKEIISSKKSVLKIHISSKKHQNGKEK